MAGRKQGAKLLVVVLAGCRVAGDGHHGVRGRRHEPWPVPCFSFSVPGSPLDLLPALLLRQPSLSYQDHHTLLLTLAGASGMLFLCYFQQFFKFGAPPGSGALFCPRSRLRGGGLTFLGPQLLARGLDTHLYINRLISAALGACVRASMEGPLAARRAHRYPLATGGPYKAHSFLSAPAAQYRYALVRST